MADASCTSFGSKSITNLSIFIPRPKPSLSFPILPFRYSNLAQRTRKNTRKKLHLTCLCTPNSQDFDILSTYEHSDGSLVFRFGNPSEEVKNDQVSEANVESEEMEDDDNKDSNVVKVLDSDHKREVIVKRIAGEVNNSSIQADLAVVSSERNSVVEIENSSSEMSSSTSTKVEMPDSVLSIEPNESSGSIVEVKDVGNVEESTETNDSSGSVVVEEESSIDKDGNERFAALNSGLQDNGASSENLQPIIESNSSHDSVSAELEPVVEVLGDVAHQETTQENVEVLNSSTNADALKVEVGTQNERSGDSGESDIADMRPMSPPSQAEPILDMAADLETMKESGETERSENETMVMPLSPSSEAEPILDEEASLDTIEEFHEKERNENASMVMDLSASEAEPTLDDEAGLGITEEPGEAERSENVTTSMNSSEAVLEVERTKEMVGSDDLVDASSSDLERYPVRIDEPVDASSSEMLELNSAGSYLESEEIPVAKLIFSSGASLLPHPEQVLAGEEDAYFTYENWLGVADGVGQWSLEGINPGVYAKELMKNCQKVVSDCNDVPISAPEEVLNVAVAKAQAPGYSTALIARFDGQALNVANIGDSGFIVLRNDDVHQRSSPMLHEFNFPVQIEQGDDPSKLIESYRIDLDDGDVVVIATDGLFDNLYEQEIMSIVSKSLEADKKPEEIAETLAMRAQEMGGSTTSRTPFADAARAAGYERYTGGKLDDVTVIVSLVERVSSTRAS